MRRSQETEDNKILLELEATRRCCSILLILSPLNTVAPVGRDLVRVTGCPPVRPLVQLKPTWSVRH